VNQPYTANPFPLAVPLAPARPALSPSPPRGLTWAKSTANANMMFAMTPALMTTARCPRGRLFSRSALRACRGVKMWVAVPRATGLRVGAQTSRLPCGCSCPAAAPPLPMKLVASRDAADGA
jgi:hypothetical protein